MISKKNLFWATQKTLEKLKSSLKNDLISITTTDTILGFIGNLTLKSFENLNKIKGDRPKKPYLVLIWPKNKIQKFVEPKNLNKKNYNLIEHCWPGPLTIIFKAKKDLSSFLTSKDGTIALRCPKHDELKTLLESFEGLFSTSANKTDMPVPKTINNIDPEILQKVEFVVSKINSQDLIDMKSSLNQTLPSTIIDVSSEDEVRVVREGAYPVKELEKFYGSKFKKSN